MSRGKSTHHAYRSLLIVILTLGFIVLVPGSHTTRVNARHVGAPTDNTQADQQSADSVNFAKLKSFISSNAQAAQQSAPIDTTSLASQVNSIMNTNTDIVFGVSIKDLNTGAVYNYGNPEAMTAASVTKVLTAVDYFKQVELGYKSLDAIMVDGNTALYDIEQMIVVSDNYAWEVLNDSLTYTQMQGYAQSIGLSSYYYGDNTISAADTAKLLGDVYQRLLINESNTQLLLGYMERANYRDLIIPAVPTTDAVYHKAGEYAGALNDAAIITNDTSAIVLSIYTQSTSSYSKSRVATLMQQITTPTLVTFNLD